MEGQSSHLHLSGIWVSRKKHVTFFETFQKKVVVLEPYLIASTRPGRPEADPTGANCLTFKAYNQEERLCPVTYQCLDRP
jgi:hypothetical protein